MIDEQVEAPDTTRVEVLIPKPIYADARRRSVAQYLKIAHVARDTLYSAADWAEGRLPIAEGEIVSRFSWRSTGARSTRYGDTSRVRFMGTVEDCRRSAEAVRNAGYSMALVLAVGLDYYAREGVVPKPGQWTNLLSHKNLSDLTSRVQAEYERTTSDATEDPQA